MVSRRRRGGLVPCGWGIKRWEEERERKEEQGKGRVEWYQRRTWGGEGRGTAPQGLHYLQVPGGLEEE